MEQCAYLILRGAQLSGAIAPPGAPPAITAQPLGEDDVGACAMHRSDGPAAISAMGPPSGGKAEVGFRGRQGGRADFSLIRHLVRIGRLK